MNVYDSELVAGLLDKAGYAATDLPNQADAIFLNTCAVREKAEETVYNRLDNFQSLKRRNPRLVIGVLGCMAQHLKNELLEHKPYVDFVLGPDSYRRLPELLAERRRDLKHIVDTRLSRFELYENMFPVRGSGINAWISISRGCDNFCTFCIVPFTRGRERSRDMAGIVQEARKAVEAGFPEITLLGQNVNSYSAPEGGFPELLEAVANIPGLKRIRYTSPHPQDVDRRLLEVMRDHDSICNHIHLPLQAGADRILKRMNRTYTRQHFMNLADEIRKYMPDCTITTDIIVGFPGESESEFQDTLDVVRYVNFDSAFMFKYSPRPGTKAAEYTDHVPEEIKQDRLVRLIELQKQNTRKALRKLIGKELEVIVEKTSKKSSGQWAGRTGGNIWVVWDKSQENIKDIVKLLIEDAQGVTLFGRPV